MTPAAAAGVGAAGTSPKTVAVDAHQYRQRGLSFALDDLNIRGPTAESVVAQAREAVANIISRHKTLARANNSKTLDESTLFSDPYFPTVSDLDQLIEAGTDPADKAPLLSQQKEKAVKATWRRPHEICANPRVFAAADGNIDPALIIQGAIEVTHEQKSYQRKHNKDEREAKKKKKNPFQPWK